MHHCNAIIIPACVWLGGRVVTEVDLRSAGRGFKSRPPHCWVQPWASCLHTRASVTEQYNLIAANGWWYSVAGEVTAGLVESNSSLLTGLCLWSPAGWLPRTGIRSGTLRSFRVWDDIDNSWQLHTTSSWDLSLYAFCLVSYNSQQSRMHTMLVVKAMDLFQVNWGFNVFRTLYGLLSDPCKQYDD